MSTLFTPPVNGQGKHADEATAAMARELGLPPLWTMAAATKAEPAPVISTPPPATPSGDLPAEVVEAIRGGDVLPLREWLSENDAEYAALEDNIADAEIERHDPALAAKLGDQLDAYMQRWYVDPVVAKMPVMARPPTATPSPEPPKASPCEQSDSRLSTPPAGFHGPLTEKYRPRSLDGVFGQPAVVRYLRRFVQAPYSTAFLFEGETGTGKTSAALALAAELGCDIDAQECGGVYSVASGEQTAEGVRRICAQLWYRPMSGSGWKVAIVNEADNMTSQAETIWLDRLEDLPPKTVIVFTTNYNAKLSQRFRDRCLCLGFRSGAVELARDGRELVRAVLAAEGGVAPDGAAVEAIVQKAMKQGRLSFRRVVQECQRRLAESPQVPA